ncbi:Conserved_hypothetical protein [Hexamita inflata]|uniref:Uncharacterized protein n=1 Tax=Hexamita inflata TaxID=28002 RepID=A0AA86PXI3_9EUKA|nr:Conserved hypothetical protein [Hexamita inflata]CAI9942902.1 Conserved hypothetical protein [Hexamita inflata]
MKDVPRQVSSGYQNTRPAVQSELLQSDLQVTNKRTISVQGTKPELMTTGFRQLKSQLAEKPSLAELFTHSIKIPSINYQIKVKNDLQNQMQLESILSEPMATEQLQQAERMIYALELAKIDYPNATYIIDQLIEGIKTHRPQGQAINKEVEELLINESENDKRLTVDQNGLARVLVKQQQTYILCKRRLDELKYNLGQIQKELMKSTGVQKKLQDDVTKYMEQLKGRK